MILGNKRNRKSFRTWTSSEQKERTDQISHVAYKLLLSVFPYPLWLLYIQEWCCSRHFTRTDSSVPPPNPWWEDRDLFYSWGNPETWMPHRYQGEPGLKPKNSGYVNCVYLQGNKKMPENRLHCYILSVRNRLLTGNTVFENIYRDPINWFQSSSTQASSQGHQPRVPCLTETCKCSDL